MATTAYLKVDFSERIRPEQLGSFHGALSDYLGWSGKERFHSLIWEPGQPASLHEVSLPVLQTYMDGSGAKIQPSLLCFGPRAAWVAKRIMAGAQVRIMHWGRSYSMEMRHIDLLDFTPHRPVCPARYRLKAYLPFSPGEEISPSVLSHPYEKRILVAQRMGEHIRHWLQLLANLGSAPIALRNLRYNRERTFVLGRYSLPMFDLEFDCSHNLPLGLGLGYRSELGLGRLARL